jgi:hypothetical protein
MITRLVTRFAPLSALLLAAPANLMAQIETIPDASGEAAQPLEGDVSIEGILSVGRTIANILIAVVAIVAVIFIVIGGLQYVISGGDEERVKKARDYLIYGIVGLVVALLAFGVVSLANSIIERAEM